MKITVILTILILAASASVFARDTDNFNSEWKLIVGDPAGAETFGFDDGGWKSVTLPRPWNEDEAFRKDIKDLSTSIAWYRKDSRLPADAKDKKVFIEFEGIRFADEVCLNGKFIGRHENGVAAFGSDITNDLVAAENTDNSWASPRIAFHPSSAADRRLMENHIEIRGERSRRRISLPDQVSTQPGTRLTTTSFPIGRATGNARMLGSHTSLQSPSGSIRSY